MPACVCVFCPHAMASFLHCVCESVFSMLRYVICVVFQRGLNALLLTLMQAHRGRKEHRSTNVAHVSLLLHLGCCSTNVDGHVRRACTMAPQSTSCAQRIEPFRCVMLRRA